MFLKCKIILTLIVLVVSGASYANNEAYLSVDRFQLDKPLTKTIMEYFYNNPPDFNEYNALFFKKAFKYDIDWDKLVCYGTENYPEKVHKIITTLSGGTSDAGIPICREYLLENKVPETKDLINHMYKLSGIGTAGGTMWHSIRKELQFLRVRSSTLILENITAQEMWDKNKPGFGDYSDTDNYLQEWKTQSNWEYTQYNKLQKFKEKAKNAMSQYYIKQFRLTNTQASETTNYYITLLQDRYLGRFPR